MSNLSKTLNTVSTKTMTQRFLDTVERVGNSVPHPVVIFLILIAIVLVLSHLLYMLGATVTYQVINPDTHQIETATTNANRMEFATSTPGSCRTSWVSPRSAC
jgi:aminobenzoyl-glutamate transport protein